MGAIEFRNKETKEKVFGFNLYVGEQGNVIEVYDDRALLARSISLGDDKFLGSTSYVVKNRDDLEALYAEENNDVFEVIDGC